MSMVFWLLYLSGYVCAWAYFPVAMLVFTAACALVLVALLRDEIGVSVDLL